MFFFSCRGTPVLLLNRVDTNFSLQKNGHENSPSTSLPVDDDSKLADTSISSLDGSQVADRSGRCSIL